MQLARVIGQAVATVKHPSMNGRKLLVVQPMHEGKPDGEPLIAVDAAGAGHHDIVVISSDGAFARTLVNDRKTPVRWTIMGICDPK
ncbi:MAG TPA: EutN/CcmL family microcompartment protein [Gemmataceae bacterium]|nr:EutN/CcmL family microcompartment protein [Gemmataceae bacterium]